MKPRAVVTFVIALGLIVGVAVWSSMPDPQPPTPPVAAPVAVPAPLPPETGVDGEGLAAAPSDAQPDGLPVDPEQLPADVQAQPDAGSPATIVETPEGIGGEVYVSSPAWKGKQRLNAGFRYPSGTLHGAWDIGIDRGTKVFAATNARVVGTNDGVKNHPSGSQYAVSGSPSNWVLICAVVAGKPSVLYYQHLSPGLKVRRGQTVKAGQLLAKSGNTGNSTGDHLHISASTSPWSCGKITQARADSIRYRYLSQPSARIFAPSRFWAVAKPRPVVDASGTARSCRNNGRSANFRYVRRSLGLSYRDDVCGPVARKKYAAFQRSLGYRGAAANGIPGYTSLTVLGKRGGFKVIR